MADYDLQYQDTHIDVLLATANELKTAGYIYKGVATPSTNPGTPTERVAYLASEPGTYTNFGGLVITSGLYSLTYVGGTWTGTQMSAGSDIQVVQTTGQSTSDVMSQKAVTDEIDGIKNSFLEPITNIVESSYSVLLTNKFGTNSTQKHGVIPVCEKERYIIYRGSSGTQYAFATSPSVSSGGNIPLVSGYSVTPLASTDVSVEVVIPQGCNFLLIYNGGSVRPFRVDKITYKDDAMVTITPHLTFDYIGGSSGDFAGSNIENGNCVATPRFIKRPRNYSIRIIVNATGTLQMYYYNRNYAFLNNVEVVTYSTANTELTLTPSRYYEYFKVCFVANTAYQIPVISITGQFDKDWDKFNIYPTDSGYHRIGVLVNVSNPASDNEETQSVQDSLTLLPNFGVIALPTNYDPEGEPVRLIIYMHGAGTRYGSSSTRFDTNKHVDPAYWLAEGYAVMDMDGDPFDTNTYYHAFIPQAMDCYVAGYKWAIEHYNIKRDGVFLGGRSMGAGNTINLMRTQCPIPIIAGCANLPTSLSAEYTVASKGIRAFLAQHKGFILPNDYSTWSDFPWGTNGSPSTTEVQLYKDNWRKYVACIPILASTYDIPVTDEFKSNLIESTKQTSSALQLRVEILEVLHTHARCPIKMFACNQDPNNQIEHSSGLYLKMYTNCACIVELRIFNSYKDYTGTGYTAHYYELQDPALRTSAVTIFGQTVNNVPMPYIEMLEFWRRYEQGL